MPNWCYTDYTFQGDEKEIGELYGKLDELRNSITHKVTSDFGSLWLGNVLTIHGFNKDDYSCRGSITFYDREGDDYMSITTETAWAPMHEMWKAILEKYYPSIEVSYICEEPGMGIYETNKDEGEHPMAFEFSTPFVESFESYCLLDDVLLQVEEIFGKKLSTIKDLYDLQDNISSEDGPIQIRLWEYEFVPF